MKTTNGTSQCDADTIRHACMHGCLHTVHKSKISMPVTFAVSISHLFCFSLGHFHVAGQDLRSIFFCFVFFPLTFPQRKPVYHNLPVSQSYALVQQNCGRRVRPHVRPFIVSHFKIITVKSTMWKK